MSDESLRSAMIRNILYNRGVREHEAIRQNRHSPEYREIFEMVKEEISENLIKFLRGLNKKKEADDISASKISKKLTFKESIIY